MAGTSGSVSQAPDAEYEVLCDDTGTFLRRYDTAADGTVAATDTTLDGVPYTATGTVARCTTPPVANPPIGSTVQRQTDAGTISVPAGARSVTLVVYAGAPTVSIGGGAAVAVRAGTSLTWSVDRGGEAGERLADAFDFTGVAGDDSLVTTTREA